MDDELLVNTLIIMAGIESKQPGAMPFEDNPLFVAAKKLKELEALKAQVEQLRNALQFYANGDHFELLGENWELNVTGDMPNWYFNGAVEDGDELVEDGSIAKQALKSTPAQCLVDHDYNIAKNAFINGVNYAKKRPDVILHKVIEMVAGDYAYGEQLRQQAKGE